MERLRAPGDQLGPRYATYGVVLHATRGRGTTRSAEYAGSVNYMQSSTATGWAHRCIGPEPGDHALLVPDHLAAGHATVLNGTWLSIEFAQAAWEAEAPLTGWQMACGAVVLARWARQYGFPLARVPWLASPGAGRGVTQHLDTAQGRNYGKTDVGPGLSWARLLAAAQAA